MAEPLAHPWPGHAVAGSPDDLYATQPPWDIGRPQPAFLRLARAGAITGCGTGEHALLAADLSLDATGVDLAATALEAARRKARDRGLTARFLRWDARDLPGLGETFDTVLDCGLFHIFGDADRAAYLASLHSVLRPGGRYLMLCLSDRQPGEWGPRLHKVTLPELTISFNDGWRVDSIEPATIDITTGPSGIRGWLASITRT